MLDRWFLWLFSDLPTTSLIPFQHLFTKVFGSMFVDEADEGVSVALSPDNSEP